MQQESRNGWALRKRCFESAKKLLRTESQDYASDRNRNVILVAGVHHDEIAKDSDRSCSLNRDYSFGQFSSLQRGVRNIPTGTEQILVWPVDLPLVMQSTVETLIERCLIILLFIPVFSGRQGHPVFIQFGGFAQDSSNET